MKKLIKTLKFAFVLVMLSCSTEEPIETLESKINSDADFIALKTLIKQENPPLSKVVEVSENVYARYIKDKPTNEKEIFFQQLGINNQGKGIFSKKVESTIEIEADINTVWNVLAEMNDYNIWNPFVVNVDFPNGETLPLPGVDFNFDVQFSDGSTTQSKERGLTFNPPNNDLAKLEYRNNDALYYLNLVRAKRIQTLTVLSNGNVLYDSSETFTGFLYLLVPYDNVQNGFNDQATALKNYCESLP